jgi:hypothetical protein
MDDETLPSLEELLDPRNWEMLDGDALDDDSIRRQLRSMLMAMGADEVQRLLAEELATMPVQA